MAIYWLGSTKVSYQIKLDYDKLNMAPYIDTSANAKLPWNHVTSADRHEER
jgi:hypothetical protein